MMRTRALTEIPYSWVVVALCLAALVSFALFRWGLGVLFPFIQEDLDTSRAELGLIAGGLALGGGSTALLAGWLVDAMGPRRLLTAALGVAAVGVLLFSRIQSPVQGMLLGILMGAALSILGPAYIKAIIDWVTPKGRVVAIGISEASLPLSGIVSAVLISFLAASYGWRTTVVVLAIGIAVSSVVFFTFYRDKPRGDMEGKTRGGAGRRLRLVVRDRDLWVTAMVSGTSSGIQMIILSYLVLFLKEFLELSSVVAGSGLAVALAGGAVGRLGWGLVCDYLLGGHRVATLALIGMLSGLSLAALIWLPSDAPLVLVMPLVFVVGSTGLGFSGVRVVLVAELAGPDLTGTVIGFTSTMSQLGGFALAPTFGLIVDRTGSYDMAWWMMVGVAAVGTLFLAFLSPQARRR